MSSPFSRSLRTLDSNRGRMWWPAAVTAALLAAWTAWFVFARVPLYETSTSARIEASATAHRLEARLAGRAIVVNMTLGARVAERAAPAASLQVELRELPGGAGLGRSVA